MSSPIVSSEPVAASRWLRLANWIIDHLAMYAMAIAALIVAMIIWGDGALEAYERVPSLVSGLLISFTYYSVSEGLTGRTIGKFVTRTYVVDSKGQRPSLKKILGRTCARFIPFEPLSFGSDDRRGWHDTIPDLYVVRIK